MARARPDTFMPLMVGDYLKDTGHLTTEQHGAYLLLLMAYWARGEPLIANDVRLASIARMTAAQWAKNKPTLAEFFVERDGVWINKRSEREIAEAKLKMEAKARAGATGANARWQNDSNRIATALRPHPKTDANAMAKRCPSPSPIETNLVSEEEPKFVGVASDENNPKNIGSKPKLVKGTRWPADAIVPEDWLDAAENKRREAKLIPIDLRLEAEKFSNYWASKSGGTATKTDWKRTWINWALTAKGAQNGQKNGFADGGGTFRDAFERIANRTRSAAE